MARSRDWKYQLIASCEPASRGARGPSGFPLSRELAFWTATLAVATASGGLILGVGAFGEAMTREGLATSADMTTVFDGGFQIMTFLSLVWCVAHDKLGPRLCATLGGALAAAGSLILCATTDAPGGGGGRTFVYMAALGLIGGGGNGIFFSAFHFANLFDDRDNQF